MVDFRNGDEVEAWLRMQPEERRRPLALTLAARAAGRALPAVVLDREERLFATLTLAVFRATALSRVAATYPTRESDLRAADAAAYAADAAAAAAAAAYAADAARAADAAAAAIGFRLWPKGEKIDVRLRGLNRSLPDLFADLWSQMKSALLARKGENWQVWTDWYDAWLDGRPVFPGLDDTTREELEVAICLIPNADWEKGAAHVNAIVADMIAKAHAPPHEPVEEDEAPPQQPSSIVPVWEDDRLVQSRAPVVRGPRDERLLVAALIALRGDIADFADAFDAWITDCVATRGEAPQVRREPMRHLQAVAALMTDEPPELAALFRILHAREALKGQIAIVREEWPGDFAARFETITRQFDNPARLSQDWQALIGAPDRPSPQAIAETPKAAEDFVATLDAPEGRALVDRGLRDLVADLTERLRNGLAAERDDPLGPDKELLAADLLEGVNNILKRLAEKALAIRDSELGRRTRGEFKTGYSDELPKQAKALGTYLAKVTVWGPFAVAGSALEYAFGWLTPILKSIKDKIG